MFRSRARYSLYDSYSPLSLSSNWTFSICGDAGMGGAKAASVASTSAVVICKDLQLLKQIISAPNKIAVKRLRQFIAL
jgi:hypothetical protein